MLQTMLPWYKLPQMLLWRQHGSQAARKQQAALVAQLGSSRRGDIRAETHQHESVGEPRTRMVRYGCIGGAKTEPVQQSG